MCRVCEEKSRKLAALQGSFFLPPDLEIYILEK